MSDYNECIERNVIEWGMDFDKRSETNQALGIGRTAGHMRGGADFKLCDGGDAVVCWFKDCDEENGWINKKEAFGDRTKRGRNEVLEVSEGNSDESETKRRLEDELSYDIPRKRYIFWHEQRRGTSWFEFLGVFELDKNRSIQERKCWYKRISDSTPIHIASRNT